MTRPSEPKHPRPPPLAGVRVLDLSRLLPGPLCGQHLADLGAEVIKIEDPDVGDYVRPAMRALANRGKRALTLNLKTDAGREAFLRLVDTADVVLEGFRPGVMARLGVGYETLAARRPSLVFCAISGYGQEGPRRDVAGHDINYLGHCGVLDATGPADGPPVLPGFLVSDLMGGTITATMGVLAALVDARATGRGRFVDVSITDALMAHCVMQLADLHDGVATERGRGRYTGGAPRYGVYAAADGRYLAVGAQERKFWDAFCEAIGHPELKEHHYASGEKAREVRATVARAVASRSADEWMAVLGPLDCCVSIVATFAEAIEDPAFAARGTVNRREDGTYALGFPVAMSEFECPVNRPSPSRGEHTDEILAELGYSAEDIAAMRDGRAV